MTVGTVFNTPEAGSFDLTPLDVLRLMDNTPEFRKRMRQVQAATQKLSAERRGKGTLAEIETLGEAARADRKAAAVDLIEAREDATNIRASARASADTQAAASDKLALELDDRETRVDEREADVEAREVAVEAAEKAAATAADAADKRWDEPMAMKSDYEARLVIIQEAAAKVVG